MVETMQTSKKDGHFNESIVNEEILEDMKKNRIDHMKYLPDMEQLEESDVMDQVISAMKAYDYDKYTEADVRRALAHDNRTPEDFQALLSPAALPLLEEIAQQAQIETRKHFGNSLYMFTPIYIANYCENYCIYQISGCIQIRIHVWHNNKPFFCKDLCCLDCLVIIRKKVFRIVNNFKLYKISTTQLSGKSCNTNCFLRISGTGCIRKKCYVLRHIIQNISKSAFISTAQSKCYDLCSCFFNTCIRI